MAEDSWGAVYSSSPPGMVPLVRGVCAGGGGQVFVHQHFAAFCFAAFLPTRAAYRAGSVLGGVLRS